MGFFERISTWVTGGVLFTGLRGVSGQRSTTNSVHMCTQEGTSAHYMEFLSGSGSTMSRWAGSFTGCPNHVNWALNPNDATHNPTNESIPAYPMLIGSGGTTDLSEEPNTIGILRNGVSIFSAWAADPVTSYKTTAFYYEWDTFDSCGGHATALGIYHHHSTPGCLQEQAMIEAGKTLSQHSPLLGWSYDGFPVYGQLGPGGVEMKMCGEAGADETHCLDSCNGYETFLPNIDDFKYRYYMSCGFDESYFPLTINCYRGCCPDGMTCSSKVDSCDSDAEEGYSADYVPEASSPLDVHYDVDMINGNDSLIIGTSNPFNCSLFAVADNATAAPSTAPSPVPSSPAVTQSPAPSLTSPPSLEVETTPSPSEEATRTIEPTPVPSSDEEGEEEDSGGFPRSPNPPFGLFSVIVLGTVMSTLYGFPHVLGW